MTATHPPRGKIIILILCSIIILAPILAGLRLPSYSAAASSSFTFIAAGDHGATSYADASLRAIPPTGAAFYLALGDMSYSDITPESAWCDYIKNRVGTTFPFQLVSGNHEEDSRVDGFIDNFAACLPDRMGSAGTYAKEYYFDYPATAPLARVIMIAPSLAIGAVSYSYTSGNSHYNWLSNTIDAARAAGIPWVVVGMHKVCITMGNKPCEIGADLMNLLINKRVDLVLQGHDHDYQRGKQLKCATVGSYSSSCVADDGSDNTYPKGVGTVFVIAGIFGGGGFTSVSSSDPEAGYFANAMGGSTTGGGRGFVKYTVAPDRMDAQLVITTQTVSGTLFSDSFSILSGASSPNPQPSFQWSPTSPTVGQTVTFTGAAVGGTPPYSFTWNFGDGGTATGQIVSRTYNAPASYTVTLTATDSNATQPHTGTVQNTVIVGLQSPAPVQLTRQYWGAFYYPWYGASGEAWRHWKDVSHNPPGTWTAMYLPDDGSGVYDPASQLYSSKSTSIIGRHLTWMDRARFDFALVSWWGHNSYEDAVLSTMLSQASQNSSVRVRLAVYYEQECCSDPSVSQIVSDLTYIYDTKANSNAYFKVSDGTKNYPVVFVYSGAPDTVGYVDRWSQARTQMYSLGKPMHIILKVFAGFNSYASNVDGWHQYAPATRYELQSGYSAFASPGYWEYPELAAARGHSTTTPLLIRDLTAFTAAVQTMAGLSLTQSKFLLIETFNEWHEGSQVEPGFLINHSESGFNQAAPSYSLAFIDAIGNRGRMNSAPVLGNIGNKAVDEETLLTFTATATDPDLPSETLTFSLVGTPSGAAIDPITGVFSWTPVEAQGPGTFPVTIVVSDGGSPALSDSEIIAITVSEVNRPPVLNIPGPLTALVGTPLTFAVGVTDPDIPQNSVALSASGLVAGMSFDPATGIFSFSADLTQEGSVITFSFTAVDNGIPSQASTGTVELTVAPAGKQPPVLGSIGDKVVDEESPFTFTVTATDPDLDPLTFSLGPGAPASARIDPATGVFSWAPSEVDGPGVFSVTITVRDNGSPPLPDSRSLTITVQEVNRPPVLTAPGDQILDEGTQVAFSLTVTDPDVPGSGVLSLAVTVPAGAAFNYPARIFSWTPAEEDGPGSYTATFTASDGLGGITTVSMRIQVNEVNSRPVLSVPGPQTASDGTKLTFTVTAADPDIPGNTIVLSSSGLPAGASFDSATGTFSWTPFGVQGIFTVTFVAADNGTPSLSDSKSVEVRAYGAGGSQPPGEQPCFLCGILPNVWQPAVWLLLVGGAIGLAVTMAIFNAKSQSRRREARLLASMSRQENGTTAAGFLERIYTQGKISRATYRRVKKRRNPAT